MTNADVNLWGRRIGAVTWDARRSVGVFQYVPEFVGVGIEVAPFMMPAREAPYEFPALRKDSFQGLPGLLADALPDKFGNRLIDAWLAETGRAPESFDPVARLCYIGSRGIGALEFEPAERDDTKGKSLSVTDLVMLANRVVDARGELAGRLTGADDKPALEDILSVGTSAGGARAKAVLAWNPTTGEFRSGHVDTDSGFEHWILKFDGIANNADKELADPQGFGRIEYAYHRMAVAAGIEMSTCRLHHEGGRSHFMTKRFDRDASGRKIHMQSLAALQHYDFNDVTAYTYEQAVHTIRRLGLGMHIVEEQARRAIFNIVARNQDDHVKNISFLMDKGGAWTLSPAYDMTYSYNPDGAWTRAHQMSLAGKARDFSRDDLLDFGKAVGLKGRQVVTIVADVVDAVNEWPTFAKEAGVPRRDASKISKSFRLHLGP